CKQNTGRRVFEDCASKTLIEPCFLEMRRLRNRIVRGQERLPTHAAVQGQMRVGLPGVLKIEANVVLAHVPWRDVVLRKCRWPPQHQIAEWHTRVLCVERE